MLTKSLEIFWIVALSVTEGDDKPAKYPVMFRAADLVLLRKDLGVLLDGMTEGRTTFANTLKYLLTVISANFGNMVSMALASVFLPFLPLLATQILLNNLLADFSRQMQSQWAGQAREGQRAFDAAVRQSGVDYGELAA